VLNIQGVAMPIKIQVLNNILEFNDSFAADNHALFEKNHTYVINMMSSPGAGKTSLLERTIERMGSDGIAVIEGDIQTARDSERLARFGLPIVQINTGTACHLDGPMIRNAVDELQLTDIRLLFIENVGNLVCPAEFRVGEHHKVAVLSVTEGEDKPLKYPLMFRESSACILNKIDLLPHLDYNIDDAIRNAYQINPQLEVFPLSCKTGEGLEEWVDWLRSRMAEVG
jgi:hydrogenase nickel incorporation protein HypB